jgi:hypothetical protein
MGASQQRLFADFNVIIVVPSGIPVKTKGQFVIWFNVTAVINCPLNVKIDIGSIKVVVPVYVKQVDAENVILFILFYFISIH